MGLLNKNTGRTWDGKGDEKRGLIDRVKFEGEEDQLVWKFPYDNLSTASQVIVNQTQEAILCKGGQYCDMLGPGTHTLKTANIPILGKLINLPFGGESPFTAEVWYINKTIKRNLKWGTRNPINLRDPQWNFIIPVRAFGEFGVQIADSRMFMEKIVGTLHDISTDDVALNFVTLIISQATDLLSKHIVSQKISVIDIPAQINELNILLKNRVTEEFEKYGISVTNFYIESINYPEDDPNVIKINDAFSNKLKRDIEGYTYQQEQTFETLKTAAGNEGSAGSVMGAGMGLGMGVGMGGMMGGMMGGITQNAMTPNAPPPPPPPQANTPIFYVIVNGQQSGPFTLQQVQQGLNQGSVNKESLAWRNGLPQWIRLSEIPELAPLFAAAPPPPPPPPPPTGI
jgi:membrane protease subunit (stomatin/prohibitin family)